MVGSLFLSERRYTRLHDSGKIVHGTKDQFDAAGISVVGVSQDDVTSHKNFCNKFDFKVELLSDTDGGLMKDLGISQAEWNGMKFWERSTFVIDPDGIVRKVYQKVNPQGHEQVLLEDIKQLKQAK